MTVTTIVINSGLLALIAALFFAAFVLWLWFPGGDDG